MEHKMHTGHVYGIVGVMRHLQHGDLKPYYIYVKVYLRYPILYTYKGTLDHNIKNMTLDPCSRKLGFRVTVPLK